MNAMATNNPDKLVLAKKFFNDVEANIAMGMLRSNGIPCILDNELAYTTLGIQLAPNNGIRLIVHQSDLQAALSLLASASDN